MAMLQVHVCNYGMNVDKSLSDKLLMLSTCNYIVHVIIRQDLSTLEVAFRKTSTIERKGNQIHLSYTYIHV